MTTQAVIQTEEQQSQAAKTFLALAESLAASHYGLSAADFDLNAESALQCVKDKITVLEVLNECAEDFDLDRIDVHAFGVPLKTLLNEGDLKAAASRIQLS